MLGFFLGEGIYTVKSNNSKEGIVSRDWFFKHGFKFQSSVRKGYHDLTMLYFSASNIAIITVKRVDYCRIIYDINKSEATHLLENSVLDDHEYI